eukprot:12737655-Ditylum_brightwellii.AAC.1
MAVLQVKMTRVGGGCGPPCNKCHHRGGENIGAGLLLLPGMPFFHGMLRRSFGSKSLVVTKMNCHRRGCTLPPERLHVSPKVQSNNCSIALHQQQASSIQRTLLRRQADD